MIPADYERFDFIHQVNPVELERASSVGISEARMMLVPYGVDVRHYASANGGTLRRHLGIPEGSFVVLTVGSHGTHKRLDFLIREMQSVTKDTHLLVVGEQPSSGKRNLYKHAREMLGDRVTFASFAHAEMPRVYASADVYVHPALYEGFGIVFLEAMASGLPVVHHNQRSMNWIVGDGGVAIDMSHSNALSNAIRALLADSNLLERLSAGARRQVEGNFSWEALLPRYLEMYSQAINLLAT